LWGKLTTPIPPIENQGINPMAGSDPQQVPRFTRGMNTPSPMFTEVGSDARNIEANPLNIPVLVCFVRTILENQRRSQLFTINL
jgi:hypothetical protein